MWLDLVIVPWLYKSLTKKHRSRGWIAIPYLAAVGGAALGLGMEDAALAKGMAVLGYIGGVIIAATRSPAPREDPAVKAADKDRQLQLEMERITLPAAPAEGIELEPQGEPVPRTVSTG